ncbi:MAG: glycosyltransferase family 4 protein [Deltaproteobacteria bacterium]|nr:glycosyltransferase family 4 protein [Deltaproteobacteria bacterium]
MSDDLCQCLRCCYNNNVGFISTRIAGTDGVSLETMKWADIFEKEGFNCYFFAGELETPEERSFPVPKAHFRNRTIREIYTKCFGTHHRSRSVSKKIMEEKEELKDSLYEFISRFKLSLLVPQNALTIPLNLPLGLALTELISETGIKVIAHHHDFFWERTHFLTNGVWEYLNMAFPPHLPSIHHVVINSSAANQLGLRTGISSTIIPNVMDFENPPGPSDGYADDVREAFGIAPDEYFILQPTRVVKRKGIEHSIELVSRLGLKATLVISHASGDEGFDYEHRIREYAKLMNVRTLFVSERINEHRGVTKDGRKVYTLNDIYPQADLITYPSTFEGFGNAFLEAIYFGKPIVVNSYSIYSMDIKPKGFDVIELDGYVTSKAVAMTRKVLKDEFFRKHMVDHNYELASMFYSYRILEKKIHSILDEISPCLKRG